MIEYIAKLRNTTIIIPVAHTFFSMYLITKVYFGYRVMSITKVQEQTLMKVYETTILKKLEFSKKFLQRALHGRKTALGIRLLKLSMIIDILVAKLYISHKRMKSNIVIIIDMNEEIAQVEYICKTSLIYTLWWQKLQTII